MRLTDLILCSVVLYSYVKSGIISEHLGRIKILFKNYLEETCRANVPQLTGSFFFSLVIIDYVYAYFIVFFIVNVCCDHCITMRLRAWTHGLSNCQSRNTPTNPSDLLGHYVRE